MRWLGSRTYVYSLALVGVALAGACKAGNEGEGGAAGGLQQSSTTGVSLTDTDGDTIPDAVEGEADPDGDGLPNSRDTDSDGDGIADSVEAGDADPSTDPEDADMDGTPNYLDLDSDGNGIPDATEGTGDVDADMIPDFRDLDNDGDGLRDADEILGGPADCNGDGSPDPLGTPAAPFNCDADAFPDYNDNDSDNDTILDGQGGEFIVALDTDMDGAYNRYDKDSDNDTIPDSIEAGDGDLLTPPIDSDGDGAPNFLDPDSDDDGLSDTLEYQNGTNPTLADGDGDGASDLIEVAAGTDPNDPNDNPAKFGDFIFTVPYMDQTVPAQDTLRFRTNIQFVDVYFAFDISGTMSEELDAFANPATGVPAILNQVACEVFAGQGCFQDADCGGGQICFQSQCVEDPGVGAGCIPKLRTGIGEWNDLNTFRNLLSIQNDPQLTAAAVPSNLVGGSEAVYQPAHCIADPALCPNISNMNCSGGGIGCPGFNPAAVRIYVQLSDASNQCSGSECSSFTGASAGQALLDQGIKFIALYGTDDTGGTGTPQSVELEIANASQSVDANGQPFVYPSTNAAVVQSAVNAILALSKGKALNTTIVKADDPGDAVDALQFIDFLEVNISGAGNCTNVNPVEDTDGDSRDDAFPELLPGTKVCWDIHPIQQNTIVEATDEPQLYKAVITVEGDGSPLDSRDVYFLIPPKPPVINPNG